MLSGELRRKLCQGQSWRTHLHGRVCWPGLRAQLAPRWVKRTKKSENPHHHPFWKAGCQPISVSKAEHLGFLLLPEGEAPVYVATDVLAVEASPLGAGPQLLRLCCGLGATAGGSGVGQG